MLMTFPKTPNGLSNQISRIRSQLTAFKKEYGFIDDGTGARYYLFYLYFLLGDNRRSSEYVRWYQKSFPDDICEPLALLCWALILNRMGKDGDLLLARTMLSNVYLIPHLLGEDIDRVDMWHSSSDEDPDFIEYLPERIKEAIIDEDLAWIRERYESEKFQRVLKQHIEIRHELQHTRVGAARSALVTEEFSLLDDWR
jgi:hypothetical protein